MSDQIQIVDRGRGAQLSTSRLTVLDVFYYLHRGYDFEAIHLAMPSLSRAEFDVVLAYVAEHREELIERDRRADEFLKRGMAEQHARGGLFGESEPNLTTAERVARLTERMKQKIAEKNGARHLE